MTTIVELTKHKRELEVALRNAAVEAVAAFREATGYTPSNIDIELVEVTLIGDTQRRYEVAQVRVGVEL